MICCLICEEERINCLVNKFLWWKIRFESSVNRECVTRLSANMKISQIFFPFVTVKIRFSLFCRSQQKCEKYFLLLVICVCGEGKRKIKKKIFDEPTMRRMKWISWQICLDNFNTWAHFHRRFKINSVTGTVAILFWRNFRFGGLTFEPNFVRSLIIEICSFPV